MITEKREFLDKALFSRIDLRFSGMCYNCHAQMLMFVTQKEDYATYMALGGYRRENCQACSLIDIVWASEWCGPVSNLMLFDPFEMK